MSMLCRCSPVIALGASASMLIGAGASEIGHQGGGSFNPGDHFAPPKALIFSLYGNGYATTALRDGSGDEISGFDLSGHTVDLDIDVQSLQIIPMIVWSPGVKVLGVFGTRPEAIKMIPVVEALRAELLFRDRRYAEAERAFAALPASHFTLQLAGAASAAGFPELIERLAIDFRHCYVLKVDRDGGDWWLLVYGDFADLESARAAASALPQQALPQALWPRRVGFLQGEYRRGANG